MSRRQRWLIVLALLVVTATSPLLYGAPSGAVAPPSSLGSAPRVAHATTAGQCVYDNVGGQHPVGTPGWECGATMSGPSSLTLGPCPKSGVMGSSNTPITAHVLRQYLCTPAFTLSLSFSTDGTTQGSTTNGVPALGGYASGATNELLEPGWCPMHTVNGECNASTSVPQRILVLKNTKPTSMLLYVQGQGNCSGGTTLFSCDFQSYINVQVGGNTTVTPRRTRGPLVLSMKSTPGKFSLGVDDKGAITPAKVKVAVTFKNTSKRTLTGISLIGLDPQPQDTTQALTPLALPTKAIPVHIGTLAPGATTKKTFTLSVNGDGDYQWNALALFNDPKVAGGNGRAQATGGPFTSNIAPLYFSAAIEPDNIFKQASGQFVDAGNPWFIKGTIKNESAYKTLCVYPLAPQFKGNASGIGLHDITVASPSQNAPPFAGVLKPGDSATVEMYVATALDGATRGEVTFAPKAAELKEGQTCTSQSLSALTPLSDNDMTIAKDSSDFTIHVDTSTPVAPATVLPGLADPLYFAGAFAAGTVSTLFESAVQLEAGVGDALSLQNLYQNLISSYPPVAAARIAIAEYQALVTATDVMANYWKTASPADKQSFLTQVASVMSRETGDFWSAVSGTVGDSASSYMDKVQAAYASGDDAQIISLYGSGIGSLTTQIATQIALGEAGQVIIAKAPALAAAFEEVAGSSVTIAALREMPAGKILNVAEMRRLWGLSQEDLAAFSKISKEYDVLIGVRGRAPISVENIEEGAVWKHENLKPKNVNPIDTEYLGFPKKTDGTVQFRTYSYSEEHQIVSAIKSADLSPADYKIVMARFELRLSESKYIKTIQGYSKAGEINVGFNYADNGLNLTSTRQIRKFKLIETSLPDGGTLYTPYQENLTYYNLRKTGTLPPRCKRLLGSVLCEVTGDMDGVYVTTTAGGSVPQDILVKVYEALAKAGWQHPETLTWINDAGDFMFGAKQKILDGLQVGGEPMIQFAPDGQQYATYLDLAKSKLIDSDNYFLDIVGGYTKLAKAKP
jgi:hypothetical protein